MPSKNCSAIIFASGPRRRALACYSCNASRPGCSASYFGHCMSLDTCAVPFELDPIVRIIFSPNP